MKPRTDLPSRNRKETLRGFYRGDTIEIYIPNSIVIVVLLILIAGIFYFFFGGI